MGRGPRAQNIDMPGVDDLLHSRLKGIPVLVHGDLPQIFNIRLQYAAEHVPVIDILRRLDPLCRGQTVPGHLLQCLLHGGIAVKAQLRGKADHRGFADLRQLSQLAGRHERRLIIMVQNIASNSFLPL